MLIRWKLKAALLAAKTTAYAVAKDTGLHRQSLSKLVREPEADRIDCATLAALCDALDCQPGDLLEFRRR